MIKWNSIKGYVLVVISGLFFLAGGILVIGNIKNSHFNMWLFWTILESKSVGVTLLIAACVGVVAAWMFKLLVWGIRDLRRGRRETKIDSIGKVEKARSENQST